MSDPLDSAPSAPPPADGSPPEAGGGAPLRTVRDLVDAVGTLDLRLQAGEAGLDGALPVAAVVQPARVVTGEAEPADRAVLAMGQDEIRWLQVRPAEEQEAALAEHFGRSPPAVVVCGGSSRRPRSSTPPRPGACPSS